MRSPYSTSLHGAHDLRPRRPGASRTARSRPVGELQSSAMGDPGPTGSANQPPGTRGACPRRSRPGAPGAGRVPHPSRSRANARKGPGRRGSARSCLHRSGAGQRRGACRPAQGRRLCGRRALDGTGADVLGHRHPGSAGCAFKGGSNTHAPRLADEQDDRLRPALLPSMDARAAAPPAYQPADLARCAPCDPADHGAPETGLGEAAGRLAPGDRRATAARSRTGRHGPA